MAKRKCPGRKDRRHKWLEVNSTDIICAHCKDMWVVRPDGKAVYRPYEPEPLRIRDAVTVGGNVGFARWSDAPTLGRLTAPAGRAAPPITAASILESGLKHMQDRASTYDKPDGERSMGATVAAFNAITGKGLSEEEGLLFMVLLKAVRSQQGALRMDSYEDGAAYFALMGETASRDRKGGEV